MNITTTNVIKKCALGAVFGFVIIGGPTIAQSDGEVVCQAWENANRGGATESITTSTLATLEFTDGKDTDSKRPVLENRVSSIQVTTVLKKGLADKTPQTGTLLLLDGADRLQELNATIVSGTGSSATATDNDLSTSGVDNRADSMRCSVTTG